MAAISRATASPALDDLLAFVRVLELGAFAKAARELGVPTSTLSRAVQRLEVTMGVRLLQRTTRTLRVTEEGAELHQRVAPALLSLRDAVRDVEASEHVPRGRLRVTAPNDIAATFIADVIAEFTREYPEVEVDLVLTQRLVDLVGEGFDIALRAGVLRDSSLIARRLGGMEGRLFASPEYLARRGTPQSLAELAEHDLVLFRPTRGTARWVLKLGSREVALDVRGRVGADDFSFVRAALVAGAGIGLAPGLVCSRDVAEGRLVHVLGAWAEGIGSLHVVYPSARHVPAKVSAFRDFLIRRFQSYAAPGEHLGTGRPRAAVQPRRRSR